MHSISVISFRPFPIAGRLSGAAVGVAVRCDPAEGQTYSGKIHGLAAD